MQRASAAVSIVLLLVAATAVAEASVLGLLLLFASILRLDLVVEVAGHYMHIVPLNFPTYMQVTILDAGTAASFMVTLACGVGAAVYRYRRWRPAR